MILTTEIKGTTYKFELTRSVYKQLLADKDYQRVQNEIFEKSNTTSEGVSTSIDCQGLLNDMLFVEMIFHYSLTKHQPYITKEKSSELIDAMFEEDGSMEFVNEIAKTLIESFTQRTADNTPKRVITTM